MAGFHTKTFIEHDDYMTPKCAWENIQQFIPKDKIIWESFFGDGKSGQYLQELGLTVLHDQDDFFENNKGDIVISNPPFSKSKEVLERLVKLNKPFILLLPSSKINTSYIRNLFKEQKDRLQIIIPRKRIQFIKNGNEMQNKCNFDCFYYFWGMNLERDIIWLN